MSARILVVDDVPANVKLLEARLSAEYFDVMTASNGTEALANERLGVSLPLNGVRGAWNGWVTGFGEIVCLT